MAWIWIVLWNGLGLIGLGLLCAICHPLGEGAVCHSEGLEFVNPKHIYKYNKVNWFGAIVVATIYGAICPIATLIYWFYKLCTIGRKRK